MRSRLSSLCRSFTLLAATLASLSVAGKAPGGAGIRWIDVGQGSAALVIGTEGEAVMIDSGPAGGAEAIVVALAQHRITAVDLWVHTHFDGDHIGGLSRVVDGADGVGGTGDDIDVRVLWDRGLEPAPRIGQVTERYLAYAGANRRGVGQGARWSSGGLEVEVVAKGASDVTENALGLALCVRVAGLNVLVPGDLPAPEVARAAAGCQPVDILWASHHGSVDGLDTSALSAVDPVRVIVTAGRENSFCHPDPRTLALLHDREVAITGAAGLDPRSACTSIAASLGPRHRIEAGDIWIPVDP